MSQTNQNAEATLCLRCQAFDLGDMLSGRWTEFECRDPVAFFGKRSAVLQDENCALCQALFSIAAGEHDTALGTGMDRFCMHAIPSQLAYRSQKNPSNGEFGDGFLKRAKAQGDSTWLVVRNQHVSMGAFWFTNVPLSAHNFGCLAGYSDQFNGIGQRVRLIDPARVDFDAIKRWIALCDGHHGRLCNPPAGSYSLPTGFAVINCLTRKLEPLPSGARFVALSYVWGTNTSGTTSSTLPSTFPQTIDDAITVVLEIGIEFIWIDRYCVPQHDCPEKREQIQKMHEIYRAADLALVAAAGEGPDYGLPGISTPRIKAPAIDLRVRSRRIVSTGRSAQETIRSTIWASRAWTYQEGLVSRRKLIFTDEQVYLHCMEREFRETIEQDYNLLAQSDNDDLATPFQCGLLHLIPEKNGLDSVYWAIRDFSERKITFQSDTLNALLGVLNFFQEAFPDKFRHLWGQPILYDAASSMGDIMASALRWWMINGAERRPEFPSWSWIGWKGIVYPIDSEPYSEDITASLILEDGSIIDDASALRDLPSFLSLSMNLSKFVVIEAETVNVRIRRKDDGDEDYVNMWEPSFVKGDVERGDITDAKGFVVTQAVEKGDGLYKDLHAGLVWLGIVLPRANFVLVLKDMGGHYERVGYIDVELSKSEGKFGEYFLGRRKIRLG